MAGYTRNDTSNNIATGNVINAADLDGEFDALVAAFHASTGHTHDGTAANGAPITKIGPAQDLVISTGAITPKTDNTVDLGSSSFEFKDLYIDGTANIDALVADTADINAGTIDGTAIGANSASTGAFTTLSASSTVTLSGGTANGVLYLNGSKVATSGSALTFDGSAFWVAASSVSTDSLNVNGFRFGSGTFKQQFSAGFDFQQYYTAAGQSSPQASIFADTAAWGVKITGSEQMRLTSTGLGIGTSSNTDSKLYVKGNLSTAYGLKLESTAGAAKSYGFYIASDALTIRDVGVGADRLTLDSSGNLGIGTSSPAYKLDVTGTSTTALTITGFTNNSSANNTTKTIGTVFRLADTVGFVKDVVYLTAYPDQANAIGGGLAFSTRTADANPTEKMRLDSSGNLGIGTSSPAYKLDVSGTARISNGGDTYVGFGANKDNYWTTGTTSGKQVWRNSAGTEFMQLDSSGNLGLGVTPSAWSGNYKAIQSGDGSAFVGFVGNNQTFVVSNAYNDGSWKYKNSAGAGYYVIAGVANGVHAWFTAPSGTAGNAITFTQAMTLDASGNLGVGTTSPTQRIDIRGNTGSNIGQLIKNDGAGRAVIELDAGGTSTAYLQFKNQGTATALVQSDSSSNLLFSTGSSNTERARITSGGDLLVGTTSSSGDAGGIAIKNISGLGQIVFSNNSGVSDYVARFYYGSTPTFVGNITVSSTATAYNTSSDYRLKDNPQPLTGSGAFIDALKPKTWNWKADGSKGVGFIAHEVQEVSPGSVVGEKDGEQMQAMEYGSAEFIANIIAELQSLRQRVALLEGN